MSILWTLIFVASAKVDEVVQYNYCCAILLKPNVDLC